MYHERQQLQRCLLHTLNNLLQQQAWTVQSLNELCDNIQATRTRWLGNYDANVLAAALQQHGLDVQWHDARDTQLTSLDLTQPHASSSSSISPDGRNICAPHQAARSASAVLEQVQQQQSQPPSQQGKQDSQEQRGQEQQQHQQQEQPQQQQQQQQEQQELVGLILNVAGRGLLSTLLGGRHWLAIRWLEGQWWNLDSQLPRPASFNASMKGEGQAHLQAAAAAAAAAGAAVSADQRAPAAAATEGGDKGVPATAAAVTAGDKAGRAAAGDGGAAALKAYLQQQLSSGAHLLLVTRP